MLSHDKRCRLPPANGEVNSCSPLNPPDDRKVAGRRLRAARLSEARTAAHAGAVLPPTRLRQLERDLELLRRFPENRRGADGLDWFDWPTT
jgi:hypothetical protein